MKTVKKVWGGISTLLVIVAAMLAIALVGVRLLGWQVYSVLSGSMEPTFQTGSLVYVRPAQAEEIKEGDIITFTLDGEVIATHRVVAVVNDGGQIAFRTKGDANRVEDSRLVTADQLVGKALFSIPGMGKLVEQIHTERGRIVAIGVGVALVLLVSLPDMLFPDKKPEAAAAEAQQEDAVPEAPQAAEAESSINQEQPKEADP